MGENKEKPEPPSIYQMRFGNEVQSADSDFSKKSAAAALMAAAVPYKPKDLELFHASQFQVKSCFRGYDKITINPEHQTLPKWTVTPEMRAKLGRGF